MTHQRRAAAARRAAECGQAGRVARSGLTGAEHARRTRADAEDLVTSARRIAAEARARGDTSPVFGIAASAAARGWGEDRMASALALAHGRRQLWRHGSDRSSFTAATTDGPACPECGAVTSPSFDGAWGTAPESFRCWRCSPSLREEEARAAVLTEIAAGWIAYTRRPCYVRRPRRSAEGRLWAHAETGAHPFAADDATGVIRGSVDGREMASRAQHLEGARIVALLIRDGFVASLEGGLTPGDGTGRHWIGATDAGLAAAGLDPSTVACPPEGIRLRRHVPGGAPFAMSGPDPSPPPVRPDLAAAVPAGGALTLF